MKIGIIGAGNVGGTLGRRWAGKGHSVTFSSRGEPSDGLAKILTESGPSVRTASVADTARDSAVVVFATPWPATQEAVNSAGDLAGKIVIDATNPLRPGPHGFELAATPSAGEMVAQWAAGAHVVKAFNTVGYNIMANPSFPGGPAAMFYCGDDAAAKKTVAGLISDLGFDPLDAGPLSQARVLEPFALLWISLALNYGYGREIAFRLMRR